MKIRSFPPLLQIIENHPYLTILVFGAVLFLPGISVFPVSIMEARNFIVAREMVSEGNWIFTTMNGELRYEKPPFPSWASAVIGMLSSEINTSVYRISTILMALFTLLSFYRFSLFLSKERVFAFVSSLVLGTSFYFIAILNEAPSDIFSHGFMLIAVMFLYEFLIRERPLNQSLLLLAAGFFGGLSILSKGPVSLYAVLLPFFLAFGFIHGFQKLKIRWIPILIFLLLMLVSGGWWYLIIALFDPNQFEELARTETGNWTSYNVRPWYYYWNFFLQSGIWAIPAIVGLLIPLIDKRVGKEILFPIFWILFAVVLLSLIPEKKPRYLLPVLFPLAWVSTWSLLRLSGMLKEVSPGLIEIRAGNFFFGLIGTLSLLAPLGLWIFLREFIPENPVAFIFFTLLMLILSAGLFYSLLKKNYFYPIFLTFAFALVLKVFTPVFYQYTISNSHHSDFADMEREKYSEMYRFGYIQPEFVWNYGGVIPAISIKPDKMESGVSKFVVVHPSEQDSMVKLLSEFYHISIESELDMNLNAEPGKRGHRARKTLCIYALEPKPGD